MQHEKQHYYMEFLFQEKEEKEEKNEEKMRWIQYLAKGRTSLLP